MKNIELLEKELDSLGASWNLFGKVDKMKFLLKKIKEEQQVDFKFDAEITKKALTSINNHGILEMKLPWNYQKIADLDIKKRVEVFMKYK
jgi:hypothetical protein